MTCSQTAQALSIDGHAIVLSPLELAAIVVVTGAVAWIAGVLTARAMRVTLVIHRRAAVAEPVGDGGPVDGFAAESQVLPVDQLPAPGALARWWSVEASPDLWTAPDEPVAALSRSSWPLVPRRPGQRRPGRHRRRPDTTRQMEVA